jgi:hypothetical protein
MIKTLKEYNDIGLACVPVTKDKSPAVPEKYSWVGGVSDKELFKTCYGIGVLCGKVSGGLECIDIDNHQGTAKKNLSLLFDQIKDLYEKYKFPIESTKTGGYHLIYRCDKIGKNQKLASIPIEDENKKIISDAIFETRGEGGYFVCDPTPGYKFIKSNIFQIPRIEIEERDQIIGICCSFNEFIQPSKIVRNDYENDKDKPGNIFNDDVSSIDEVISILELNGWKDLGNNRWTRPGKSKGVSATLGKAAKNCFYVFSANAYPFEENHGYSPFQVIGLLKYNSDFKQFAKDLAERYQLNKKEYKAKSEETKKDNDTLDKLLKKCFIDPDVELERPPIALYISDNEATRTIRKRLFTLGNFSCIIGKSKSRKTFLVSMLTAAMLSISGVYNKFFGNLPESKRQIIYFDTEQSDFDAATAVKRVLKISNMKDDFLGAFKLRDLTYLERCDVVEYALSYFQNIGLVVIDGIADLVKAINDEEEATRIVQCLMRWSKQYNCHIITVLHQNKNDNFATGWVGSLIMKKAEVIISVNKGKGSDKPSTASCDYARGMDFNDFDFHIENGLPVLSDEYNELASPDYFND